MQITKTSTSDGLILPGLLSEPSAKTDKIIIHIHGMAGDVYSDHYHNVMHSEYIKNGVSFLAGVNRGIHTITEFNTSHGEIKVIGNAYEVFEECVYDIEAWVNKALELGYREIWLQGHSLGTSKIAYYMKTKKPTNIAGLILISPSDMIGLVCDPEGKKDHDLMYPEAQKLVNEEKVDQLLSHRLWGSNKLSAKTYLNFFEDTSNTAVFNYGREDLGWDTVHQINIPVIAFTGTKDDGIIPSMDAHKAMEKLESELINSTHNKTVVFEGAEHDFEGFEKNIVDKTVSFISGQ